MKKFIALLLCGILTATALTGCGSSSAGGENGEVIVYNWGEYIDPETLTMFEEETGIKVVYDEFETNEIMYPKVEAGSSAYDVVCPSDYMVQKMIENDLIQELDYDKIPNAKENIGAQYYEQAAAYDPGNKYCVPYCWGTVGIIYNKTMVDTPPTKWADLWDEKYADNILMMDSIKDSFMVALKKNGFSSNSLDESELQIATDDLIAQKPLVQAYVVDQVRDKMIGGEAAIGVMFSGDAIYVIGENPDLDYVIPEEGTNVWIDGWVIPKNAPNKENAEKFIDFMCRPDVALKNFEYITYGTPNTAARELIEDEDLKNSPIAFPDLTQYHNLETFLYLGEDGLILTNTHVIDGCDTAKVELFDKTEYDARLVGADTISDIAVLKIDADGLTAASFGESKDLAVGDKVAAIGNPLGEAFRMTLTDGIISAIERGVSYKGRSMTLLQTNTAINEGNSGGALFNMYGQVIGITNMKMMSSYSSIEGIGFAIPSSTVQGVVNSLIRDGEVRGRPSIGITVGGIPASAKEKYGLPDGLYVSGVQENSDAAKQGIKVGDIITEVNFQPVTTTDEISDIKNTLEVGDAMIFKLWRDGETFEVSVMLMDTNDLY